MPDVFLIDGAERFRLNHSIGQSSQDGIMVNYLYLIKYMDWLNNGQRYGDMNYKNPHKTQLFQWNPNMVLWFENNPEVVDDIRNHGKEFGVKSKYNGGF